MFSKRILTALGNLNMKVEDTFGMAEEVLLTLKGIGPKAVEELIALRPQQKRVSSNTNDPIMKNTITLSARALRLKLAINTEYTKRYTLIEKVFLDTLLKVELVGGKHIDYFTLQYDELSKEISRYASSNVEVLKQSFVGSLSYKLKRLPKIQGLNTFQRREYEIFTAKVVVQFLEENVYKVRKESKVYKYRDDMGVLNTSFRTEIYLQTNGTSEDKNLLKGYQIDKFRLSDKAIHTKVGGSPLKLTSKQKKRFNSMGQMKLTVSDITTEKLLKKGYSLSKGMNSEGKETMTAKEARYSKYARCIMALKGSSFSISYWDDARLRMYPKDMLVGINPQGKLWESLMLDSAEPYLIDDNGARHLMHIIMTTLNGRCTLEQAVKDFNNNNATDIMDKLSKLDPYSINVLGGDYRKAEEEFGETILLIKAYKAYIQYLDGLPTYYLFGKDLTNSGIGIAGALFKAKEMLYSGNYGSLNAVDSHAQFGKGFGDSIPRDVIKPVHHGLAHGSTWKSLAEDAWKAVQKTYASAYVTKYGAKEALAKLTEDYAKVTSEGTIEGNAVASYGVTVRNIDTLASWGGAILNSKFNNLMWTTMDGEKAQSTAYAEKVELLHHVPSAVNETGMAQITTIQDMPLVFDNNGFPMVPKEYRGRIAKRGFYANLVHSYDATLLRRIIDYVIAEEGVIIPKHDDYITQLNYFDDIEEIIQDFISNLIQSNELERVLDEVVENAYKVGGGIVSKPALVYGTADGSEPYVGVNFLQP